MTIAATRRWVPLALIAFAVALLALAATAGVGGSSTAAAAQVSDRYALANGCFVVRSRQSGQLVRKTATGYAATAGSPGEAEAFRMKATALGSYLFFGRASDYLSGAAGPADSLPIASQRRASTASDSSADTDWVVDGADGGALRISLPSEKKVLSTAGAGNDLVLADEGSSGPGTLFTFETADGCAAFPEIEVNASGEPSKGGTAFGETRGLVDAHLHHMAFEFLGGSAHCGRPWHPYGVTKALVDCPDHGTGAAPLETAVSGTTTHDPEGWPSFRGWPTYKQLTHEQTYYKWMERAWRGGLRLYVNLLVDNAVLCEVYPIKRNSCNEMDSVRLQVRRIRELENYIDAQSGGPGKGWFRIVENPFEARRVVNEGKLAVVLGIEISKLFDCGVYNDQPECDRAQIDRQLDEVYKSGVRSMQLVNKFDNALSGVAGDAGQTGIAVNNANKYETNKYWEMQTCEGAPGSNDREQSTAPGTGRDELAGNAAQSFVPIGTVPVYPEPPHCNRRGLTDLGEHLVRRMIEKKMIVDPDHMSVRSRRQLLALLEAKRYSGVLSSHTWSSPDALPRIYSLGGFVTPYGGSSTSFVEAWRKTKPMRQGRFFFGFGYGADMNGFGSQGPPRPNAAENPVTYPFKSFDGNVTLGKQVSGTKTYDINTDGVAHYGLFPDWVEDLRKIAGEAIVEDMGRGSEAYLQMWERAEGIKGGVCQPSRNRVNPRGVGGIRLGDSFNQSLRRGSQPRNRLGRVWTYCVKKTTRRAPGKTVSVLTPAGKVALVVTTAPGHRALNAYPTNPVKRLGKRAKAFGRGLRVRSAGGGRRFFYGVSRGRIRYVGVASRSVAKSRKSLNAYLKLSGLR